MFGLGKKRQEERSNFLTVFQKFYNLRKENKDLKGKTIKGWNVYPEFERSQFTKKEGRAEIRLSFTDNTTLILNTSDCDIEIKLEEE